MPPLTNIKKGEIDMCDTRKNQNSKVWYIKVIFCACDILPAHTSGVWYLKGDHQNSAISVILACYTNTSVYIKTGHLIKDVTIKQTKNRE